MSGEVRSGSAAVTLRPERPPAREEAPCNLCGGADEVVVGTRDRDGRPLRTVLCRRCGLVWTSPRPSAADMNAYYETTYRADYKGQAAPPLRKIVRGFLGAADRREALRPFNARTMVDVGCGAGELVYMMRRAGVDASGLDPGIEFTDFARSVLGVPIQSASVDGASIPAESQDLVTMFHALEHVPDPRAVLATVRGWLKPGGHAVVEVPNIAARVQAPSHQYHYAHLYHFTGGTLGALGEVAGLRLVETRYTADRGNVICVFRRDNSGLRPPAGLEGDAARLLDSLRSHTVVGHYLSVVPFSRALARLRRRLAENRLLRRIRTVEDALRWAESL